MPLTRPLVGLGVTLALVVSCGPAPPPPDAPWTPWTSAELELIGSLSPLPEAPPPSPTNKVADDPQARALGHALFFDARLSANGEVACATCHQPEKYFTDGLVMGKGVGTTKRHTPTVLGAAWAPYQFWDGRKDSLWSQTLGPLEHPDEHGLTRVSVARAVFAHHRAAYEVLFGPMPPLDDAERFPPEARPLEFEPTHPHQLAWGSMAEADREAINRVVANIGKAIEAYERALTLRPAPFDAYVAALRAGDQEGGGHLSLEAKWGLRAFIGKAQCVNCHNGPLLSDHGFHNLGLTPVGVIESVDMGRSLGAAEVKGDPFNCLGAFSDDATCQELRHLNPQFEDFQGAFKTPSLRNVAQTAPYMHTGQFATLHDVINFYRTLPGKPLAGHRELVLSLLDPTVRTEELVAFLESLTGPLPDKRWLVPPEVTP